MRILLVSPYLPHAGVDHGGGRVLHELARELSRDHEVGLLAFVEHAAEAAIADALDGYVEVRTVPHDINHISKGRRLRNLASLAPSASVHLWHPAFARALEEMTADGRYDIVQLCYPWMARYLDHIRGGVPVMELIECFGRHWRGRVGRESLGPAAPYFLWDWWRGERFERRGLRRFRRIYVLTDEDRDWLLARDPRLPVRTRRVGVDRVEHDSDAPPPDRHLLFVGSFRHPANRDGLVWFLDEVWPLVRAGDPGLGLRVAGAPAPQDLADRPGVEVLGFVDDLAPLYARALACISPIRFGGGVKTKGLEAMAHGAALVTTALGAEGYAARDGEEIEIADRPEEFARRVLALAADPARARRLGAAGRTLVRSRHDWDTLLRELDEDYLALREGAAEKGLVPGKESS